MHQQTSPRRQRLSTASAILLAAVALLTLPASARAQWTPPDAQGSTNYPNGSVGVGTASPATPLHVRTTVAGSGVRVEGSSATQASPGFDLFDGATSGGALGLALGPGHWSASATPGDVVLRSLSGRLLLQTGAGAAALAVNGGSVGIGTLMSPTAASRLTVFDTAQNAARITLSGQEFYAPSNSSADGAALVLGVNRPNNKQLWIGDSAALAQNGTNAVLRVLVISGTVGVDAVGTNGLTPKPLSVGNSAGVTMSGGLDVSGTITGGNIQAKYQDVAEWVPSSQKLAAGTVVVLDPERANQVISSTESYDTRVAGVVSERPGIALGEGGEGKVLVATTGRVRVKVDATRAPVRIGDLLVTGEAPGVAMKSEPVLFGGRKMHAPGTIIGKALEPLEKGTGEILVLLSLQ
ncbi:MAG TPA: hypothetical protein VNZ44_09755 [Pyrinomonadaceae bacterium]|nr:hypothetical protein [Pyrinomonadaceae bacterium]